MEGRGSTDPMSSVRRLLPWLAAAGAGAALALSFPGPGLVPLALVFPGLLLEALRTAKRGRRALLFGWVAGTVQWLIAANWVVPVMHDYGRLPLALAVLCLVAMSILLAATWAVASWLTWYAPAKIRPWLFPFAWIALDALRRFPPYSFQWDPVATAFSGIPALLGSLPLWGATGLSWAALAVGAGLWATLRVQTRRSGMALAALAAAMTVAFGLAAPAAHPQGAPVTVAALQPGTSLAEKWDPARSGEIFAGVVRLSRRAAAAHAKLIAWPESAVPYDLERDPTYRRLVTGLARELDANIVLNSVGTLPNGGFTNSAYLVTPAGVAERRYDKVHLVPFGEYVPFFARFAFARSLVREVGRFTPGHDVRPLTAGRFRLGMAICFEIVFADHAAAEVRRAANLLVTISNDGWYGYSWAPHQHFGQAVLRAVETRRWVLRAALTGISGFISPAGRVVARMDVGRSGVLVRKVRLCDGMTPRVRFGDWWLAVCALAALALLWVARS